jgi:hypothetical protein
MYWNSAKAEESEVDIEESKKESKLLRSPYDAVNFGRARMRWEEGWRPTQEPFSTSKTEEV